MPRGFSEYILGSTAPPDPPYNGRGAKNDKVAERAVGENPPWGAVGAAAPSPRASLYILYVQTGFELAPRAPMKFMRENLGATSPMER